MVDSFGRQVEIKLLLAKLFDSAGDRFYLLMKEVWKSCNVYIRKDTPPPPLHMRARVKGQVWGGPFTRWHNKEDSLAQQREGFPPFFSRMASLEEREDIDRPLQLRSTKSFKSPSIRSIIVTTNLPQPANLPHCCCCCS